MSNTLVQIDRSHAGIAIVSMQRAEKRNALNVALLEQLAHSVERLQADASCRVMILRGDGPVFSAGLDLSEANDPAIAEKSAEAIRNVIALIRESPLIVIAAASGAAYAGGAGLLAACDLVVLSDDFRIGFPEVRRGMVAAIIMSALVGRIRAGDLRELLLVAEPIEACRAQQLGLANWVVPADQVMPQALTVGQKVLAGGPTAVRETKRLLNQESQNIDLALLRQLHEHIRHGAEAREGFAAFCERRQPNWNPHS